MIIEMLTCAMMLMSAAEGGMNTEDVSAVSAEAGTERNVIVNEEFWTKKKSFRIGYSIHTFQNASGSELPVKFGAGLSRCNNVWFHRQPIGGVLKFAFDHGIDLNYSMFDMQVSGPSYSGPSGYIGNEEVDFDEDESIPIDLSKIGMHYISVGYALGVSATVNPVSKLRINGYFHFVPSAGLIISGTSLNLGFMPYCKYGAEVGFGGFGVGFEWGSGVSEMSDVLSKLISDEEGASGTETPKAKYYSNYGRIYLAFRFGKKKR